MPKANGIEATLPGLLKQIQGRRGTSIGLLVDRDTDFVTSALEAGQEQMERKYRYKARGYDFAWLVERVGELLDMTPEEVLRKGKYPEAVIARSVVCYFGARELGLSMVELARRLHLSQPAVSQSVQRGEKIASEKDLHLVEINQ